MAFDVCATRFESKSRYEAKFEEINQEFVDLWNKIIDLSKWRRKSSNDSHFFPVNN